MSHPTQPEPGVTLKHVPRTVTGRQKRGNRVTYTWKGKARATERVVLMRCREAGYEAFRLPSPLWRTLGEIERLEAQAPAATLAEIVERVELRGGRRRLPRLVEAVRSVIPPRKLRALVERHAGPDVKPSQPGTPDLLVFKRKQDGTPYAVRFVEVKRGGPERERLKPHQLSELRFLKSLGLKAGVFRLEERPAASTPAARRTR